MGKYAEEDIDSSEIECPNCGERVYAEIQVCPKCGLHFYPDSYTDEPVAENPRTSSFSISAVLAGWAASAFIAFLINYLASRIWSSQALSTAGQILVSLAGPLGALAGGYLSARVAGRRIYWHGLGVSVLSLITAVLLETFWYDLFREPLRMATVISLACLIPAGPLGAWIWNKLEEAARLPARPHPGEQRLYLDLLSRVRHDIDTAERLIDYERRRSPSASRSKLIQSAIDRLDQDRR